MTGPDINEEHILLLNSKATITILEFVRKQIKIIELNSNGGAVARRG